MKTAVVTGASRGLGEAIAQALKVDGYRVIGTSTTGKKTDSVDEMVRMECTDRASIASAAEEITNLSEDGIDVLYNNAGHLGVRGGIVSNIDDALKVMQVNVLAVMDFTAQLLPQMNAEGLVINMSSAAGDDHEITTFNYGAYNVSKRAIDFYTKSLAQMIKDRGIKVIATDPEWVATDMGGSSAPKKPDEVGDEAARLVSNYDSLVTGEKYVRGKLKQ